MTLFFKYALVLVCLMIATFSLAQETIRLTNGEWPPYTSQQQKYQGPISRVIKEAFALEGIKVEYGFFPWARSFALSEQGKWDGSIVWYFNQERARAHFYSDPILDVETYFFHLKSTSFDWQSIEDLYDVNLGSLISTFNTDEFEQAEKAGKLHVEWAPNYRILFKKLSAGRISAVPLELDVGYSVMRKELTAEEFNNITYHPKPLKTAPLHVIFSKKAKNSQKMRRAFNKGLKKLKASGKYDEYFAELSREYEIPNRAIEQ
jgi:polar amino acid transport system substrate-binding protein